jgi:transposase
MSTSILYHTQSIIGCVYERTFYEGGACIFQIHPKDSLICCPICGSHEVQSRGSVERTIRIVPAGLHPNYVRLNIPRVYCPKCGKLRQITLGFADEFRFYSKPFERYVQELCKLMTVSEAAEHLNVSWDLVKEIHKGYLERK